MVAFAPFLADQALRLSRLYGAILPQRPLRRNDARGRPHDVALNLLPCIFPFICFFLLKKNFNNSIITVSDFLLF